MVSLLLKKEKKITMRQTLSLTRWQAILELGWGPIYVVEVGHTEGKNLFGDTEES